MALLERVFVRFMLLFTSAENLNAFFRIPENTAILVGSLIAVSGAILGSFLLLRGLSLTSDAISHTVLLGIVVAFMIMTAWFGLDPDTSSPWLIIGAAAAGVATVLLTELIHKSGLVRQDAALGLVFPLLFALAVIFVSRYVDDTHMDEDAVMVGEIGVAWANTSSVCLGDCEEIVITPDSPLAEIVRQCTNCRELGISPRDEGAEFVEICTNCGEYSAAAAWSAGLSNTKPELVFWPKSITTLVVLTFLTVLFVVLFFKELKLSTFDSELAHALGFKPTLLTYALMVLVSLVAVGAFDAVGSILVVAFFIIPPAAAYILTDRLMAMLGLSSAIGAASAYFGYDLARGSLFGVFEISRLIAAINRVFGSTLAERWNSSISASIVVMMFLLFLVAWLVSPGYGIVSSLLARRRDRRLFREQVLLGHVYHHQDEPNSDDELAVETIHVHTHWTPELCRRVIGSLRARRLITVTDGILALTDAGRNNVEQFRRASLHPG